MEPEATVEMSNAITLPISVDTTFSFGDYNITPFTYTSVVFQCKYKNVAKKWVPATMVRPTIIHHNKSTGTYKSAMRCIAKKCNLENKTEIYIITDGEPGLIAACLKSLSKCSLLRWTRHFRANGKDFLIDMGMKGNMKNAMLDVVFGENELIEAKNKQYLREKMKSVIILLSEMEKQCLLQGELLKNNARFSLYIESREKTVLRKNIRSSMGRRLTISVIHKFLIEFIQIGRKP